MQGLFIFSCIYLWIGQLLYAQAPQKEMKISGFTYLYVGDAIREESNPSTTGNSFGKSVLINLLSDENPNTMPPGFSESYMFGRMVYALDDSMLAHMSHSVLQALNSYWSVQMPDTKMEVEKAKSSFREFPPFKPKLSKSAEDKWHIFLRIVDRGSGTLSAPDPEHWSTATRLLFECKVLNGKDGKETFARSMEAKVEMLLPPPGAYPLEKLPGMPASFLKAFDSSAQVFFSSGAPNTLSIDVKPACLYIPENISREIRQLVRFKTEGDRISVTEGPEMSWAPGKTTHEKLGREKNNTGGKILGDILTMTTGVGTEKTSTMYHMARVQMKDPTQDTAQGGMYTFHVQYKVTETKTTERERNKRSDGSTLTSVVDADVSISRQLMDGYLTMGTDTIAWYGFRSGAQSTSPDIASLCWDGENTETIIPMPRSWSNSDFVNSFFVSGFLYGKSFSLENRKAGNQLDVYYDNIHVATLRVEDGMPRDGIIYKADIPKPILKALTMFVTVPFYKIAS